MFAGVFGVLGCQLIMNPGCFFLRCGQVGGHSEKAPSQCPGPLGQFAWASWLACQFPLASRGGPVDLRLVPVCAGVGALERRLIAVETVLAALQYRARACDRLIPMPELDLRADTQPLRQLVQLLFALVSMALTLVGLALTLVGDGLTLTGQALALVGDGLALVGLTLTLVGLTLTLVESAFTLVSQSFTLVGQSLTLASRGRLPLVVFSRAGHTSSMHPARGDRHLPLRRRRSPDPVQLRLPR